MELTKTKYKQTEVGLIPEDWEVVSIDSIMKSIVRGPFGGALKKEFFVNNGFKVYEQRNAIYQNKDLGDYYVDENKFRELKRFEVKEGDFIVSCSGTIGKIYRLPKSIEKGIINQALLKLTVDEEKIDPIYFLYQFIDERFQDRVIVDQGGAMKNLVGMPVFKVAEVLLPPLPEQKAIAEVLSDTDNLLQALEKKLAKKRALKQGAMQKLLTPKEDWEVKRVEDVAKISTGSKNTQDKITDGEYPFFVRSQTVEKINTYSYDCEAVLTVGDGVGTGKVFHYVNEKFELHQRVYIMNEFAENIDGYYFYLFFSNNFYNRVMQMTAKSSVDSVRREMIADMHIPLPPIEEQNRIATILSDMDKEIELIEKQLSKYKTIKQGLMQELLTGKIRLTV